MRRRRRRRRGARGWVWGAWLAALGSVLLAGLFALAEVPIRSGRSDERARMPPASVFASRAACTARKPAPRETDRAPRIGTWNLRWFPHGAKSPGKERGTDLEWLACAIANLDVDVLAIQEITQGPAGRAALASLRGKLGQLTGRRYRAFLDDCRGDGFQHVGFLYDADRVELSSKSVVPELNPGRSACHRSLRPGVAAHARFAGGPDLHLIGVHLDSGTRARDYRNRRKSIAALARVLPARVASSGDSDLLLLGDFNTMGCETCTPSVSPADEIARLEAELDGLSLKRLPPPPERACTQYYRGRPTTLDHIAAAFPTDLLAPGSRVDVHGPCRDLGCARPTRGEPIAAFDRLSDHCPLLVELRGGDR